MTAKRTSKKTAAKKSKPKKAAKKKATARKTAPKTAAKKKTAKKKVVKAGAAKRTTRKASAPKKAKKASSKSSSVRKKSPRVKGKTTASSKSATARKGPALDLKRLRRQLLQKHADLLASYTSSRGETRRRESDGTEDYIDYAVSSYDRDFSLSLTELERSQLNVVEEALKRIDRAEYGRCTQCERPIPAKRLEVQPWAIYCVRCQELADSGLTSDSPDFPDDDDDWEVADVELEADTADDDDEEKLIDA